MNKETIHETTGNVFTELGFSNAEELSAKTILALKIQENIKRRHLTQAAAGDMLGITQSNVSALLNGHLSGFSTDRLFRFLNKLGCDIKIKVCRAHPETQGQVLITH